MRAHVAFFLVLLAGAGCRRPAGAPEGWLLCLRSATEAQAEPFVRVLRGWAPEQAETRATRAGDVTLVTISVAAGVTRASHRPPPPPPEVDLTCRTFGTWVRPPVGPLPYAEAVSVQPPTETVAAAEVVAARVAARAVGGHAVFAGVDGQVYVLTERPLAVGAIVSASAPPLPSGVTLGPAFAPPVPK